MPNCTVFSHGVVLGFLFTVDFSFGIKDFSFGIVEILRSAVGEGLGVPPGHVVVNFADCNS